MHYLKFVYLARVCSQHFHSSQYKDRSLLRGLLPNYSPVKSRKLKPDAIPMEFVEDNATTVVEKDLNMYSIYVNRFMFQVIVFIMLK